MSQPVKTSTGMIWTEGGRIDFSVSGSENTIMYMEDENTSITGDNLFHINGKLEAIQKSFVTNSPDGKRLEYGALEGEEYGVYYRGKLIDDYIIDLPKEWEWLVDSDTITVQLTPYGKYDNIYVKEIKEDKIILGNKNIFKKNVNCFFNVYAERKDIHTIGR